jgi:hypothetical protein
VMVRLLQVCVVWLARNINWMLAAKAIEKVIEITFD